MNNLALTNLTQINLVKSLIIDFWIRTSSFNKISIHMIQRLKAATLIVDFIFE